MANLLSTQPAKLAILATNLSIRLSHLAAFCSYNSPYYNGDPMFRKDHERLMREARAISNAARAALWRALVTARQIEKLVRPRASKNEITRGDANEC